MRTRFLDLTNKDIDKLVQIAWDRRDSHDNEYFRIPERSEKEIIGFVNDETDIVSTEENRLEAVRVDLSRFRGVGKPKVESETATPKKFLIAVDSGVVHLGEFVGGGVAFAVRGAAVCLIEDELLVLRYNTGAILVDEKNHIPLFSYIGKRLGKEEHYLRRLENGELVDSDSILGNANQIRDRFRNFVERIVQEEAVGLLAKNGRGLLIIDGALSGGTYDTPAIYVEEMLRTASNKKVDVVAISKKTRIALRGRPISALFDDRPTFVGYLPIKNLLAEEREALISKGMVTPRKVEAVTAANELFAVRFGLGPPALTFRVDVQNSVVSTPAEVLNNLVTQCQIQGCYPKPLIQAHQYSSFMYQDVQTITADLIVRTGVRQKEDQSMSWMFEPFGAFGK